MSCSCVNNCKNLHICIYGNQFAPDCIFDDVTIALVMLHQNLKLKTTVKFI